MAEFVIDETNIDTPEVQDRFNGGLMALPPETAPTTGAEPLPIPVPPRSEWSDRIKEMERTRSRLSDMRASAGIPALDQGGSYYCTWHAVTMAVMLHRAKCNAPHVPLSAFGLACKIKRGANTTYWSSMAASTAASYGIPSQAVFPQGSYDPALLTPACDTDAAKYLSVNYFARWGLASFPVEQIFAFLFRRVPVFADFMNIKHSLCLTDPVQLGADTYGVRFVNSYGGEGTGVMSESVALADGGGAIFAMAP